MNTQLYNSLIQARNFLIITKRNKEDIIRRKELINRTPIDYRNKYRPYFPFCKHKDFDWGEFILLLLVWIGVFYPFYVYFCNRKYRKVMRAIDDWERSPDGQKLQLEIKKSVEIQQKELDRKLAEYQKYYSDNYYKCLGFLPDWARKIETVDDISHRIDYIDELIPYVKRGAATLYDAMENYAKVLREEWAREERMERQEYLDQLQRENIEALNAIARNQEKTNEELERIYREKFVNRR